MGSVFICSLFFFIVGATGFTKRGLHFSETKRIQGRVAIVMGSVCTAVGASLVFAALYFGTPDERSMIVHMLFGIFVGISGTWQVMRG
jgi:hypothetical protein